MAETDTDDESAVHDLLTSSFILILDYAYTAGYTQLFAEAAERLQSMGGTPVVIDFTPFAEVTLAGFPLHKLRC